MNISFDETNNKYLAELLDTNSQNSSKVVINNYDEVFPDLKKSPVKPYKCDFKGCAVSFDYPFSLAQHKVKHNQKETPKMPISKTKKKGRSFSLIKGMNSYVMNYMKSNKTWTEDHVDSSPALNGSVESPKSEYSSDCLLFRHNIECIFNDQNIDNNINDKIVTKIKDWFKP